MSLEGGSGWVGALRKNEWVVENDWVGFERVVVGGIVGYKEEGVEVGI